MGGRKRKLQPEREAQLAGALLDPCASIHAAERIWNAAAPQSAVAHPTAQRVVARALQPLRAVFSPVALPCTNKEHKVCMHVADLEPLLRLVCQESPHFAACLREAALAVPHHALQCILYHDEVQAGNPLSVLKSRKGSLFYVSFLSMRRVLHSEAAWLCVAYISHDDACRVQGGLSAACRHLVRRLLSDHNQRGFGLQLQSHPTWVRVTASAKFVSDMDAQRATFRHAGASGNKPCLFCSNILSKRATIPCSFFRSLEVSTLANCHTVKDEELWESIDLVESLTKKKDIQAWEKTSGFKYDPHSLLYDREARKMLTILETSNDVMHLYFCNGICNWELASVIAGFRAAGLSLDMLRTACEASSWRGPSCSDHCSPTYQRNLWSEKMLNEDRTTWRGSAQQTRSFMMLMTYYAVRFAEPRKLCELQVQSLLLLTDVIRQLRVMQYAWLPLTPEQCRVLASRQQQHHEAFLKAYDPCNLKPKHHGRLHLPGAAAKWGWLPLCEVHESKHRQFKEGSVRFPTNDPAQLQMSLLPRLLRQTVDLAEAAQLGAWRLQTPLLEAPAEVRALFPGRTVSASRRLCAPPCETGQRDLVLWDDWGGIIQHALSVDGQFYWHVQDLTCTKKERWGTVWRKLAKNSVVALDIHKPPMLPAWWRDDCNVRLCLH